MNNSRTSDVCKDDLDIENSSLAVACESCLEWSHLSCLGKGLYPNPKFGSADLAAIMC